ncbi:MAG: superfamily hydrolase [Clostridia bacterium]|jgi:putative hydrolase of the HAD superfamily|nr:superfamily hydrolase [Clostridia bacterium]
MIKNIVFDIGRVLLDYQPMEFLKSVGIGETEGMHLNEIIFKNDLWLQLDRGIITKDEAIRKYCTLSPLHTDSIHQIMNTWPDMLTLIEGTSELLRELIAKGYHVYLLSNFQEDGFNQVYNKFTFLKEVKGKVISYEAKLLKPEKEIYIHLLEKYDLIPEETVFIDDLKENVEAAIELGIKGIVFESAKKTREELCSMGVDA